jgi:hypothetical protein
MYSIKKITTLKKQLFLTFTLLLLTFGLFSQDFMVRGFIYAEESGEGVAFAKVILTPEGSEDPEQIKGVTTDLEGFFTFTAVKKGSYELQIRSTEYESIIETITVGNEEILTLRYNLKKGNVTEIEEVKIYAEDRSKKTKVDMSVNKLDQKSIERLPSFGAESDVMAALAVTPGVVTTGDQGGQMYVRGGTPIQNLTLLDGMTVYNPFHSIGFFSVFETELIKSADIYTGGFPARYGGRIASIMDITYRDGNMKKFGGKVSASPFMGKMVLEGPLFKSKDPNSGAGGSYIFAGKQTIIDQSSRALYPHANDGEGLPFTFTDLHS